MAGESSDREVNYDFEISSETRTGVYANNLHIWYSPYEFVLDWGLTGRVEAEDPDDPTSPLRIPVTVVARVRLPTGLIFDVLRALR